MFGRNAFKRLMEFLIGPVFLSSEQVGGIVTRCNIDDDDTVASSVPL